MAFEEEAAYALAAWKRFDGAVTNSLTKAVTGAFALIAAADGDLAAAEAERFLQVLRERAPLLEPLDFLQMEHSFRDITGALLSDPAAGRRHALELVGSVRGDPDHCELVRSAAEIAVAADDRRRDSEQEILQEICDALGIAAR